MQFVKEGDLGHLCVCKLSFARVSVWTLTVHSNVTGIYGLEEQITLKEKLSVLLNKYMP